MGWTEISRGGGEEVRGAREGVGGWEGGAHLASASL